MPPLRSPVNRNEKPFKFYRAKDTWKRWKTSLIRVDFLALGFSTSLFLKTVNLTKPLIPLVEIKVGGEGRNRLKFVASALVKCQISLGNQHKSG